MGRRSDHCFKDAELSRILGIGTISYSLYLSHWPIIFYARFIFGDAADTTLGKLALLVCMLLVAVGMYFL